MNIVHYSRTYGIGAMIYREGGFMVVSQLMIRFMVAALLSAIVFLSPSIAVGSSSILDSGKSSKEIAEEIRNREVPALSFQEEDSFESYLNFYKELISEE